MNIRTILTSTTLLFGAFLNVSAQRPITGHFGGHITPAPSLSQSEMKVFYELIILNYFRRHAVRTGKPAEITLTVEAIPADYLPRLQGVQFSSITRDEISRLREVPGGVEYYDIFDPIYREGRWYITVVWARISGCDVHQWSDKYEFRRVNGKWKLRRTFAGVGVGHCATQKSPPLPVSPR